MIRWLRILILSIAVAGVVAAGLWAFAGDRIILALAGRIAATNLAADRAASLPDGLHLAICGAGGPMPDPIRSGPCQLVIAGHQQFLVDAGGLGARNLTRMGFRTGAITAILLTHFHSDHIDGLGETLMLRWAGSANPAPTPVLGPPGVAAVVDGFNAAYALDSGYRTAHHGPAVMPPGGAGGRAETFAAPPPGEGVVVWDRDGVRITAFSVPHEPASPAVGYRFDYKGRSLVISGDTGPSPTVETFARGADLLAHEALAPKLIAVLEDAARAAGRDNIAKVMHDIPNYHTSPAQAAQLAARAGVKHLVFTHVIPPLPHPLLHRLFLEGVEGAYGGPADIAKDGDLYSLPAGGEAITLERLF